MPPRTDRSPGREAVRTVCRRIVLVLGVALCPSPLVADASDPEPFRHTTEYYVLKTANTFGVGGWNTFAFRRILARPHADAVFRDLLEHGSLAGQLYALSGLWFTDPEELKQRIKRYREMDDSVPDGDYGGIPGCGTADTPPSVSSWVWKDTARAIRLDGHEDTITAWRARTGRHAVGVEYWDIGGGAWPDLLAGRSPIDPDPEWLQETDATLDALRAGRVPWVDTPPATTENTDAVYWYQSTLERWQEPLPRGVLDALDDPRFEVRCATVRALSGAGPHAWEAAGRIAAELASPLEQVRHSAAYTLATIGPWATRAWPVLLKQAATLPPDATPSREVDVFRSGWFGEAFRPLARSATPKEIPYLKRCFSHRHAGLRWLAVEAVEYQPELTAQLLPEFAAALEDPAAEVRAHATNALVQLAASPVRCDRKSITRMLLASFEIDRSDEVRVGAAAALGALGEDARPALPALRDGLRHPALGVRVAAAHARWKIAREGPESVPSLLTHLELVTRFGYETVQHPDSGTTASVLGGLAERPDVARALVTWLRDDPDGFGRVTLLRSLGNVGRETPDRHRSQTLAPTLQELAEHWDADVARAAADALYNITGDARRAVRLWIARYRADPGGWNGLQALRTLARFGEKAKAVRHLVPEVLGDAEAHPQHQVAALELLVALGPDVSAGAVETLQTYATTPRPADVTVAFAETAAALGSEAQDLLPVLVELLDHQAWAVREASRQAIEAIVAAVGEEESGKESPDPQRF